MIQKQNSNNSRRSWRVFSRHLGRSVDRQLERQLTPLCPCCGDVLEARPTSRLAGRLPLGARAYDLDCRGCRRFWLVVRHTQRSIRLVRMRRFVAAVRAAAALPEVGRSSPSMAPQPTLSASATI